MTFISNIHSMERRAIDGFVIAAHWRHTLNDEQHSFSAYGVCNWSDGEINIPYENLTEQDVLDWVWQSVDKTKIESGLSEELRLQKNPINLSGVPW